MIYDWEDFGKVGLPGFDVCVFLLDATGALDRNAGLTAVLAYSDPMVATLRGRLLEGLGLRADAFPHLVLASLAGFLVPEVGDAVRRAHHRNDETIDRANA